MKNTLLIFVTLLFFVTSDAQRDDSKWFVNIGFNAINNAQSQNPFFKPGDWATKNPFTISVERKIVPRFYIEAAYSLNGFDEDLTSSDLFVEQDFTYHSFDLNAKLYYGDQIFQRTDWVDLYFVLGGGYFTIDDSKASFNAGGGVLFWLDTYRRIGIRLQAIGKVALGSIENSIDSNHYQYNIQAVFKL